jgi:hypothetical protein
MWRPGKMVEQGFMDWQGLQGLVQWEKVRQEVVMEENE